MCNNFGKTRKNRSENLGYKDPVGSLNTTPFHLIYIRCKAIQLYSVDIVLSCSDFGYYRPGNSSECVEQEEMRGRPLEFCLNGTTEQLQTSG